jgi:hypothetical protein
MKWIGWIKNTVSLVFNLIMYFIALWFILVGIIFLLALL